MQTVRIDGKDYPIPKCQFFQFLEMQDMDLPDTDNKRWCFVPDGVWLRVGFSDADGIHIEGCNGDSGVLPIIASVAAMHFYNIESKAREELNRIMDEYEDVALMLETDSVRMAALQKTVDDALVSAAAWRELCKEV